MLCPALWLGRKLLPYADGDDVQCACGGYFSEWELVGGLYFFFVDRVVSYIGAIWRGVGINGSLHS